MRLLPMLAALPLAACVTLPDSPPAPAPASWAWATFDSQHVLRSGTGGLADRAAGRAVTIDDPVRVASVTKLHVALGVMRLVEQGKLDLDRDVSDYLGWRLRNPSFPDAPITLRLLLSHRSSLTDAADYILPIGTSVERHVQNPKAWDAAHPPGTYFRYTNLNLPVVATAMERVTGERLDRLMQRLVFAPLGVSGCLNWSGCAAPTLARAVVLYAPDGKVVKDDLHGAPPPCLVYAPADGSCDLAGYAVGTNGGLFSPQGGLRISVADLAKVGGMMLRRGTLPDGSRFLTEASIAQMERIHWRHDGTNGDTEEGFYCAYGLAVQTSAQCATDDLFGDGKPRIGHAGDAYGVRSGLWIDPATGRGIAFFATGLGDAPPKGRSSYRAVEEWLGANLLSTRRR
ncbi:MAG TPA: serine hydrolase domain-containing protein [Allosphingosinicella sp.]|nr:serine hydrolase domain-containing protein [Allosphingosinicella sp.]